MLDFEPAYFGEDAQFAWQFSEEVVLFAHPNSTNFVIIPHVVGFYNTSRRAPITRTLNTKPCTYTILPQPSLALYPTCSVHGIIKQGHDISLFKAIVVKVKASPSRLYVLNGILIRHPHGRTVLGGALHFQRVPAEVRQLPHDFCESDRRRHARRHIARHTTGHLRRIARDLPDDRPLPALSNLKSDGHCHRNNHHHEDDYRPAKVLGVLFLLLRFDLCIRFDDTDGIPINGDCLGDEGLDSSRLVDLDQSLLVNFSHNFGVGLVGVRRVGGHGLAVLPLTIVVVGVVAVPHIPLLFQFDHIIGVVIVMTPLFRQFHISSSSTLVEIIVAAFFLCGDHRACHSGHGHSLSVIIIITRIGFALILQLHC
mmetsp:Transcript_10274/g.18855  ORF Transcript_10274/g.18855 Transcript_10274/m.18855 type:complete len:368 (-) Transcript_10274:159-1262(-)